jgi:signal transduction histidine kinase
MHGPIDRTFSSFQPAVVGITIWIILSLMCLVFFLVLSKAPELFENALVSNYCNIWYELGAAILFARLLILVVQIVRIAQSDDKCLDAPDLIGTGDTTFGYMFIMMCIDTYQTYVFTILPFPLPWAVLFTLTELTRQLIRLYTCSHRITSSQAELRWIVNLLTLMLLNAYVVMVMVPSVYLEGSFRNRFRSEQLQREATASKKEMVGFLSNDVRVPLQYMLHAMASVDFVRVAGDNVQPLLNDIHRHSAVVNEIADELLLLVRINENRYTSKLTAVPDLCRLLDDMSDAFLRRRFAQSYTAGRRETAPTEARDWFIDVAAPAVQVQLDESCLLAALRHLLAHLTQPTGDDEEQQQQTDARGDAPEYALDLDVALFQAAISKKTLRLSATLSDKTLAIKVTSCSALHLSKL